MKPLEIIADVIEEHGADVWAGDVLAALEAHGWQLVRELDAIANED
jgi:hypothetical protein